ncbi:lactonase family protein [Antarcticibacterium flavum]|uniref:Lactonase family protein n=1 Tax=Antarcticibacterium flavum TaxID=2058175 RepID=A0A5B7WY51_9FLAO|nr:MULTISPECIES: lactonase family protein [Antarcticibacterium]MCM4160807.1 6-phosphogluconolactonase [Antarcticibacterium sp. W02-3]QCY67977.1 lactonase family protein [Antarcticibacterium flavum]
MIKRFLFIGIPLILTVSCKSSADEKKDNPNEKITKMEVAYIGTYTKKEGHVDGQAEGIYTVYRDPETGKLEKGNTAAKVTNPSFVKMSKDKDYLYAVSELGAGDAPSGYIHSFKINEDHGLEEIGKISTEGFAPCYIAEDITGNFIFVANYVGGVVMLYEKAPDGSLMIKQKVTLENPDKSHPHSVNISANNKHVFINDLGNDRIWFFDFDAEGGELLAKPSSHIQLTEGSGPRHFAFSSKGEFGYSINELNSTVSAFEIGENGELAHLMNISTLPEGYKEENSAADIHLHPSGKYLYASNRGHNSIVGYKIEENGKLGVLAHTSTGGETPRNFAISGDGDFLYVANQDSHNIVTFQIDKATGELIKLDELQVKTPVCIEFL